MVLTLSKLGPCEGHDLPAGDIEGDRVGENKCQTRNTHMSQIRRSGHYKDYSAEQCTGDERVSAVEYSAAWPEEPPT